MISELLFEGGVTKAPLTIRVSPRAKTMRLRVDPRKATVLLTIPKYVSRRKALRWADGHRSWVEAALAKIPARAAIENGATIMLHGQSHIVDWREDRSRIVRIEGDRLIVGGPRETVEARLIQWLKAEARRLLEAETREYAAKADVTVNKVGVGDPVSRWGSCSTSGTIRYSWRLILAPDWVRRATVAHEVAHRIHMNHGPEFHALVKILFGEDPNPARLWLRREGASLHQLGHG
ncbi:MAG: M48 family metallopeptidase [Sphingosinicella sp.]|nr:M48 family metallopeptidase [Sphingosinicella sp.]